MEIYLFCVRKEKNIGWFITKYSHLYKMGYNILLYTLICYILFV